MNILLVNDDGYFATGIKLLYDLLKRDHKVVIVAPNTSMSAKSVSITLGKGSKVEQVDKDIFSFEGTPADCVAFGLSSLNMKFDLVISGCNHGFNVSYDTMYSGTVGACLQALTFEVPAIAISCDNNFEIIEKYFLETFNYILKKNMLSKEYMINVNFPLGEESKGIKETHIHYRNKEEATFYVKNSDGEYLAMRSIKDNECLDENSDVYAVHHGYISISKLNKTLC